MCTNTSYAVKISSVHSVVYFAIFRKLANPCGLVIRPIVSLSRALQLHSVTQRSRTGGTEKKQKTSPWTGQSGYAPSTKFTHATCARLLHTPPGSKQPRPYTIRGTQNKRETEPVAETITKRTPPQLAHDTAVLLSKITNEKNVLIMTTNRQ